MRSMNQAWYWLGVISLALVPNIRVEAATVEAMTLEEMARRADMIFIGRSVGSRADWNAQHTRIYTHTSFEVERFLKGGAGERSMTIRLWGGQLGPLRSVVPGTPDFTNGEQVLLFCVGSGARVLTLLGLALGKFTLTESDAGERILKRDISGLILVNYRTDSIEAGSPPTRYLLSEVESRILAALGR